MERPSLAASTWPARLGFLAILPLFAVPLFVGLRGWDLRSDEAIYSYSVDRMLEVGDWLTPHSIPTDEPFLEKPPLKPWIVAGAIKVGLLPHDEFGLRFWDALFGAIAFAYIYWLGVRLAGPVCGFVAVFILFTLDPLLFEHGLRSNNMEGPLFLAYCGGVFHFLRWAELLPRGGASRRHALAMALYFVLGFMTKFVAALFLPTVCLVAFLWRPRPLTSLAKRWTEWLLPALVAIALIAPWFIYQVFHVGQFFWTTIYKMHVVERFTAWLDPCAACRAQHLVATLESSSTMVPNHRATIRVHAPP